MCINKKKKQTGALSFHRLNSVNIDSNPQNALQQRFFFCLFVVVVAETC